MAVSKVYLLDSNEINEKVVQAIIEHQFFNSDTVQVSFIKEQKIILTKPLVDGSRVSRSEKDLELSLDTRNIRWMKSMVLKDNFQHTNFNYSANRLKP